MSNSSSIGIKGTFQLIDDNTGATRIRVDPSGNVGIGTSSPPTNSLQVGNRNRLRISNSISDYSVIGTNESDTNGLADSRIVIFGQQHGGINTATSGVIQYLSSATSSNPNNAHEFFTRGGNLRAMVIKASNGYVGVGTAGTPTNILQVGSGARLRIANSSSDYTMIGTNDTDGTANSRITIYGQQNGGGTTTATSGKIEYISSMTSSNTNNAHEFFTQGGNLQAMVIKASNGYVGIGESNPLCPLHIGKNQTLTNEFFKSIVGGDNTYTVVSDVPGSIHTPGYDTSWSFSIMAKGLIGCNALILNSDARIKKDITFIEDSLQKLRLVEPKKYKHIENKNNHEIFGFIAQQVKEHFPEAVILKTDFIPNVNKLTTYESLSDNQIRIQDLSQVDIVVGDKVRIVNSKGEHIVEVISKESNNTVVLQLNNPLEMSGDSNIDKYIYIYGKEVKDFHTLNKDYLFTINFSATQELDRMMDWHTKEVDRSVSGNAPNVYGESLLTKIKRLENEKTALETRLLALETRLQNAGL
jgi:hypothetical protein